jgi:dihydrofolate reductase
LISHVAALSENRVIGVNGDLPWRISADLKHFKALTLNKCIVMGRKTFESLPSGALPKRTNIVISRDLTYSAPNCQVFSSIDEALNACAEQGDGEIMIVGGAEIYKQTLAVADRLYLTIIHESVTGDAYYPEWENDFKLLEKKDAEENGQRFSFCTFIRKSKNP